MLPNKLLLVLFLFFQVNIFSQVIFVKAGETGNGSSWENATGDLQAALFAAKPGWQIWVAKGIYHPTTKCKRTKSFCIPSQVGVYGGFLGYETRLDHRNWNKNTTVLSGEIGSPDNNDNSYNVVYFKKAGKGTILDGFTIADGNANGKADSKTRMRYGGGIYIDGSGNNNISTPVIQNCKFINNSAKNGGAVYNNGDNGNCSPIFKNCKFISNKAVLDGGAIFNDARQTGKSNPSFINCSLEGNIATYGGAILNFAGSGESKILIENSCFQGNYSHSQGDCIYSISTKGNSESNLINCKILEEKDLFYEAQVLFSID